MNNTRIIGIAMSIVVGVILLGNLLVPVIKDAQETAGPVATYQNSFTTGFQLDYIVWSGEEVHMTYDGTLTINDRVIPLSSVQRIIFASNAISARTGGAPGAEVVNLQYLEWDTVSSTNFTLDVVDGEYTFKHGVNTYTGSIDWMVYAKGQAIGKIIAPTNSGRFLVSTNDDDIILGNIYVTGANDTFYSYYNGELTVNDAYADDSEVILNKTLVPGTTDVYVCELSVRVGNETFVPNYVLVDKDISGHYAKGASYEIYGIIPLIIIVALLVFAIGAVVHKRND